MTAKLAQQPTAPVEALGLASGRVARVVRGAAGRERLADLVAADCERASELLAEVECIAAEPGAEAPAHAARVTVGAVRFGLLAGQRLDAAEWIRVHLGADLRDDAADAVLVAVHALRSKYGGPDAATRPAKSEREPSRQVLEARALVANALAERGLTLDDLQRLAREQAIAGRRAVPTMQPRRGRGTMRERRR